MEDNENELIVDVDRDGRPTKVCFRVLEDEVYSRYWDANAQSGRGKSSFAAWLMSQQELIWQGREENLTLGVLDGKSIHPAWEKPQCRGAVCPYCRGLPGGCPGED
jgi:hypothetical protein